MPKKIYDIKPPKTVQRKKVVREKIIQKKVPEESPTEISDLKEYQTAMASQKTVSRRKKEKRPIWQPVSVGALIIVIILGAYLFFKLPKADIVIWPKVDILSFTQTITADKSASGVDLAKVVIPAQYFQTAKTNAQDFPATGNGSNVGQAQGTITIYNKYDPPTPFSFKAGTHFLSDTGKLFVTSQKVAIPAAKKSGSKIIPGSVQIQVQAVEGGSDYNIAPSNFSIPGLKGTSSYYSINAASTTAMAGGYTGKVKKVTDDDIQGAKDVLTKKTAADAIVALKGQISSDYVLLNNAMLSNVTDASTKIKSGAIADTFSYSVSVQASALAFKKADIDQFAKNYIISQIPDGKTLLDNSFKIDYSASTVDVSGGKATLNLNFSSGVYQAINKNALSLSIIGENASQAKQTISNALGDQATNVQVTFWPFWVLAVPNQNVVHINLKFQ